jgi:hypothetical protein
MAWADASPDGSRGNLVSERRSDAGGRINGWMQPRPSFEEWGEPVDFLADADMTGASQLKPDHITVAIAPFVFDTAARTRPMMECQRFL